MKITQLLLIPNKYSRPGTALRRVTKIALHYVGNPNTTALANRNYFNNLAATKATSASSHYIIDMDGSIIQCVPENEIAYCTNQANSYSISIECCHPRSDGQFTAATRQSLKELCADLCRRYGLDPVNDLIRHYDVTGKMCPLYWVTHKQDFVDFKNEVKNFMKEEEINMEELNRLKEKVAELEAEIGNMAEKVFESVEEVPQWGRPTVEKLIGRGILVGDGSDLDLGYTLLRLLVINDRAGLYE